HAASCTRSSSSAPPLTPPPSRTFLRLPRPPPTSTLFPYTTLFRSYARDLRRYRAHLDALGRTGLAAVESADITAFLVSLREGTEDFPPLAASSAGRALVAVRGLHRFAVKEGLVPRDVAREVKPPPPPRRLPKALPVDDVLRLLDVTGNDDELALRDRALLELLYSTGARISEAVGLDVDDLDADQRTVVLDGKGGKQRLVPVGRPAL